MAWYKTGTVAVTNASTTVTGTGTNFVSGAQVGDGFLGPNELLYEITAINSATSLTIAPAYGGATASSQSYAIAPTQGLVASLASDVTDLITDYQSVVDNVGAGKFGDGSAASPAIRFTNDQDTGFFRDTANEIAFATAGVKRGEFSSSGIQLLDGQKFIAGTASDLQIFSDGTKSYLIESGSGDLELRATDFVVKNAGNTKIMASFNDGGTVQLRYDNDTKLATTSTGVDITGTLTSDGLTVDGTSDLNGTITVGTTYTTDITGNNISFFRNNGASYIQQRGGHPLAFQTNDGSDRTRLNISNNGDISFYEDTGTTAKFFWDASAESLGIGTSSPDELLHISGGGAPAIRLQDTTNANTYAIIDTGNNGQLRLKADVGQAIADSFISFEVDASEAMRISGGNLLVGTTDTDVSNNSGSGRGININGGGGINNANTGTCITSNRLGSDGTIIDLRKDGTTVGSIGVTNTIGIRNTYIAGTLTGLSFANASIFPTNQSGAVADNSKDLGYGSGRFDDIYATNATIQTSDRNEKQDIDVLSDAETRVAVACKGLLRKFRWKDAVAEKGDEARTHFGIIAQDLQAAFAAEGLDAGDYAMFISSTWTDEETGEERTRMGVRYSELLAFIIAAI